MRRRARACAHMRFMASKRLSDIQLSCGFQPDCDLRVVAMSSSVALECSGTAVGRRRDLGALFVLRRVASRCVHHIRQASVGGPLPLHFTTVRRDSREKRLQDEVVRDKSPSALCLASCHGTHRGEPAAPSLLGGRCL